MKPINLTEEQKENLFIKFAEKFKKELDNFVFNMSDTTLSVKTNFREVAKEKVLILYTPEAYLRMNALVDSFTTEVGWYGLVDQISPKLYRVYDVKVCKQYVNGGKVDTEDADTLEFFDSLTDDEIDHMHFQAHSHVNMSTSASGVDLQNQADVVRNMGKTGFYLFQIWNKKGEISTYLYDLDNNTYYDSKDVEIAVEDPLGTVDDFVESIEDLVVEKKYYPYQNQKQNQNNGKEKSAPTYLPGYYGNEYGGYGYSDW